jgi:hypothetical protein
MLKKLFSTEVEAVWFVGLPGCGVLLGWFISPRPFTIMGGTFRAYLVALISSFSPSTVLLFVF